MSSLETAIPPPAVAALAALAMWVISLLAPTLQMPAAARVAACAASALGGLFFSVAGVVSFRRAQTTLDPTEPETASSLVSSGIYRVTRNPMYVGLCFVLFAWGVFLSSAWALLGLLAFVLYLGRFQIAPEERALARLFGTEYTAYQAKVRRWL
jgi:protein-S-isoprenylcysteine O-methyltransferase Ste14